MAGGYQTIVTASQLCRYIKALLEEQKNLSDLMVKGELSNVSYRSALGHLYFSLRDGEAVIRCVMFSRYASSLKQLPQEGCLAVVRGNVSFYERDGSVQIIAYDLQELGDTGKVQKNLEDLKKQLISEGLFSQSHKRPIPQNPRAVAVITSPDGAALHDITQTFAARNPLVKLIVYPAVMQGLQAPSSIIKALETASEEGSCQSVIIARGGGSSEDLSAFNQEALVRAAYACPMPLISAVGHEVDFTLLDYVADARASTPTGACLLATQDFSILRRKVQEYPATLYRLLSVKLNSLTEENRRLCRLLEAKSPGDKLKKNRQRLEYLLKLLVDAQYEKIRDLERQNHLALTRLELLNPAALMLRGYSITQRDGQVITSVKQLSVGDQMTTLLEDGSIESTVVEIKKKGANQYE